MTRGFVLNEFLKRRDPQLAAQLTSLGKLCDVARGSLAMSLLFSVATRVKGVEREATCL